MITKNKLAGQSSQKITASFDTSAFSTDPKEKTKKPGKKLFFIFVPVGIILVAGITLGIWWLVSRGGTNNDPPADEILPIDETFENGDMSPEETTPSGDEQLVDEATASIQPITKATSANPTTKYGRLMLINPNFIVETDFINSRKSELISLATTYGILELHSYNGDNLMDPEAAGHLNQMLADYTITNPGHTIQTVSCFRSVGTNCGRLCMPTGASDHHTGLTCDLVDPAYGTSLDTSTYEQHIEWQWLKANSYKYGFVDRFPEAWAGGSMDDPMNVDAGGSTGLYETWHYRYVGLFAANEIATGVYNNGQYDSLEHYLLARGLVSDLAAGH